MKEKRRKFTEKDIEVLISISKGYTDADIADEFKISIYRVRNIVNRMLDKTGTVNRAHLVYQAVKEGLIK